MVQIGQKETKWEKIHHWPNQVWVIVSKVNIDHLYSRGWGSCDAVIDAFQTKLYVSKAPLIDGFISSGIWTLRALNPIQ